MINIDLDEIKNRAKKLDDNNISILPYQKVFYDFSIRYSAECSINAFGNYNHFLKEENTDPIILVSIIQEAIGHAANLSWYFFNEGNKRKPKEICTLIKNRSNELRKKYNIEEDSPLKDRKLRNMFEHFDEKLDIFLISTDAGNFYPAPQIGSIDSLNPTDKPFKLLDIEKMCLVLLNEKFFFEDIAKEVFKIYKLAKKSPY